MIRNRSVESKMHSEKVAQEKLREIQILKGVDGGEKKKIKSYSFSSSEVRNKILSFDLRLYRKVSWVQSEI